MCSPGPCPFQVTDRNESDSLAVLKKKPDFGGRDAPSGPSPERRQTPAEWEYRILRLRTRIDVPAAGEEPVR